MFSILNGKYRTVAYTQNMIVENLFYQFSDFLQKHEGMDNLGVISDLSYHRIFQRDPILANQSELVTRGFRTPPVPSSPFLSLIRNQHHKDIVDKFTSEMTDSFPNGLPNNTLGLYFFLEDAIDWIIAQMQYSHDPLFGYFHLFPPHEPYTTRKEFVSAFDNDSFYPNTKKEHYFSSGETEEMLRIHQRAYDEYILYADAEFGRLVEWMEKTGKIENTCLVLTSDHGQLFERGIHGHVTPVLYEPLIHVPLIISYPGQQTRQDIFSATSCIDLLPSLVQIAGVEIPGWCEGETLPVAQNHVLEKDREIYSLEAKENSKWGKITKATIALIKDDFKLIHYLGYPGHDEIFELYDLRKDPEELIDIYSTQKDIARTMKDILLGKLDQVNAKY
jgi:hypothetical protein